VVLICPRRVWLTSSRRRRRRRQLASWLCVCVCLGMCQHERASGHPGRCEAEARSCEMAPPAGQTASQLEPTGTLALL
jgi:hypothetical protein